METVFKGLFDSEAASVISVGDFLLCLGFSLVAGAIIAISYMIKSRYTKSFLVTLGLLPAVVCVVIMMVNGNIGAGVAVAGAFSLVRFRSVAGTAKEIVTLFLAMGAGLVIGMGYIGYGILFSLIMSLILLLLNICTFGTENIALRQRILRVTIPEDLDYGGVFDGILREYTDSFRLVKVKSVNMGSLFKLTYNISLKRASCEKELIDRLRERNGNLEISVSYQPTEASL